MHLSEYNGLRPRHDNCDSAATTSARGEARQDLDSSEARDRNNPTSANQISLQISIIE
jgi:hypothetical protein